MLRNKELIKQQHWSMWQIPDPSLLRSNPVTAINLMPPSLKVRPMCVILDSPLVFGLALTTPATFIDKQIVLPPLFQAIQLQRCQHMTTTTALEKTANQASTLFVH